MKHNTGTHKRITRLLTVFLAFAFFFSADAGVSFAAVKAPVATSITGTATTAVSIKLSWKKVSKYCSGYRIYRNGKAIKNINSSKTLSFTNTGLKGNTSYKYSIRTIRKYSQKQYYNTRTKKWVTKKPARKYWKGKKTRKVTKEVLGKAVTKTVKTRVPSAPKVTLSAVSPLQVKLTWNTVSGAAKYYIYRDGKVIGNTTAKTYTNSGLAAGKSYKYTVKAYANGAYSAASSTAVYNAPVKYAAEKRLESVSGLKASSYEFGRKVKLTWNAVSGATGYIICKKSGGEGYTQIYNSAINQYIDEDVEPDIEYSYKVTAYKNAGGTSDISADAEVKITTAGYPEAPEGCMAEYESGVWNLTWPGLAKEELTEDELSQIGITDPEKIAKICVTVTVDTEDNRVISGSNKIAADYTSYSLTDDGKPHSVLVKFKTYPVGDGDILTIESRTISFGTLPSAELCSETESDNVPAEDPLQQKTKLAAPEGFRATGATKSSISLAWTLESGVTYKLYRNSYLVKTLTAGTYTDTGLSLGEEYTYLLVAEKEGFYSSDAVTVKEFTESASPAPSEDNSFYTDRSITFTYNGATIYLGQTWSTTVKNSLGSCLSFSRPKYAYPGVWSDPADTTLYLYGTDTYKNFLAVYVANDQIIEWQTNGTVMGVDHGTTVRRGDVYNGEYFYTTTKKTNRTVVTTGSYWYTPDKIKNMAVGGAMIGGFSSYTFSSTDYTVSMTENQVGFHFTNAIRALYDTYPLEYSSVLEDADIVYYGARAVTETMKANDVCAHHFENCTKGPLAGQGAIRDSEHQFSDVARKKGMRMQETFENVATGSRIGEACICYVEVSEGHTQALLENKETTHMGCYIVEGFHCEMFGFTY